MNVSSSQCRRAMVYALGLGWLALALIGCSSEPSGRAAPLAESVGAGGTAGTGAVPEEDAAVADSFEPCVGAECPSWCDEHPGPGCPCGEEGDHLICGQVETSIGGQLVCGKGVSVCHGGKWGECIINSAVTLVPPPPPGYRPMGLGNAALCANNPCDPTCHHFPDDPSGLANPDAGLAQTDGGLTLAAEGGAQCVPVSCVDQGKNCGPVSDKCGALLNCGTCTFPQTCGGGGTASVCGTPVNCTNLCLQQVTCNPSTVKTTITGRVYAPNGVDPLPNVVVYVPNATVAPFAQGVACEQCGQTSGSPLVSTTTDVNGNFTLQNVPATNVGAKQPIPLVMQLGRWRRQVTLTSVPSCQTTNVSPSSICPATTKAATANCLTRLPRNQTEGDIPKMAFSTGKVDALECIMRKIGVDDSEFSTPMGNGRVHLFAGGANPGTYIAGTTWGWNLGDTWYEDALLGSAWLNVAPMLAVRMLHAEVLLPSGQVFVVGGASTTTNSVATAAAYDTATNTWTAKTSMTTARLNPTATLLGNGKVLVAGGLTYSGTTYQQTAELYTPGTNSWVSAGTMTGAVGRRYHTATLLPNGRVLVVGGTTNGSASTNTASLYDPTTNTWSAAGNLTTGRFLHTATLLSTGRVLVAGGVTSSTNNTATAELYNPATNTWSTGGTMSAARRNAAATLLPNGRVLVAGGIGGSTLKTTTIYDPVANSWSAGASMIDVRSDHSAVLLNDGTVLVVGGDNGATYLGATEVYDPATATWARKDSGLNYGREYHTTTLLPNGEVLMVGGYNGSVRAYAERRNNSPLHNYDMVLFPCQGVDYAWSSGGVASTGSTGTSTSDGLHKVLEMNLANYANSGGRVFTTHYNYTWLYNNGGTYVSPLSVAANWNFTLATPNPVDQNGFIDQTFPKGALLATWLQNVGASTTLGRIFINTLRQDFTTVNAPTQNWMSITSATGKQMHFTFNTPIGVPAAQQCGRVVYSDFHVYDSASTQFAYPTECGGGAMTPQEKLLEFMLFDLASCIQPDQQAVSCTPVTCAAQGLNCGQAGDGCGNAINCGTCTAPATCGGGGLQGVCGTQKIYTDGYFVRDYDASQICPPGATPVWRLWSWATTTPSDTHIDFSVRTAKTKAGLDTAPSDIVLFSNPPGPAALVSTINWPGLPAGAAVAHAANLPTAGMPSTQYGSTSLDRTFLVNNRPRNNDFVRITVHLAPSSNKLDAPTLSAWDILVDCPPME